MSFTWNNFDLTFLKEILRATDDVEDKELYLWSEDKDIIVSCINTFCDYPNKQFVMKYRGVIEQYLLLNYPEEVKNICKSLNIISRSFNEKQALMTKKAMSASLINAYMSAMLNISGLQIDPSEYSNFRYTRAMNMSETKVEEIPLYDFQEEAVKKLKKHFLDEDKEKGMLVMPTGSGKSRTATYFLIKEMISRGYQIIWIAHRHMLLDQAADCFVRYSGLSKIENPGIKNYRVSCISGEHLRMSQVDKHEIIVASISSIYRNKDHLRRILRQKVMVIVDEAHHTFAPTYIETLKFIQKYRKKTKVLGITATPVRANEDDSIALLNLYGNKIIYSVTMSDLITKGILAIPKFVRIETNEEIEPLISENEECLIRRYGELPETLVAKIASSKARNKLIIDEYMNKKDQYGKTIIFAMNIVHCRFIQDELLNKNVKCGCIYSGKEDNNSVIRNFKEGKLDVLVNVNIMTEGADVPDIQTVFLTRPTQSEGFLMQMIGRGMRGKAANGTETVYIVDFHDKWNIFTRWLNPEWIIKDEHDSVALDKTVYHKQTYREYEWGLCQEIYKSLSYKYEATGSMLMLPVGWYSLIDDEGEIIRMLIFENQLTGLVNMLREKPVWKDNANFQASHAIEKYFTGFCEKPNLNEMQLLVDNVRNNEIMPTRYLLENRKEIEPYYVVERSEQQGLDLFELAANIYDENETVKDLYLSKEYYIKKVCDAKIYRAKNVIIGQKVEELPVENIHFIRGPYYDLVELTKEVKDEMFDGEHEGIGRIVWTDKPYKLFYGRHWIESHNIEINAVLNSKSVPRDVVKYVLYHEMLHRDYHYHDKEFRGLEHKYPRYEEWEHFLDDNMHKFDIKEW